ncbi:J domain-containing protein [Arthrobacter sp. FW306-04-A]|uniref:J domain-containing protein n=1 Tax=Arthrobacter sp. FW306-04-A TaxID=2879619 RepID=UPI0037C04B58|nr:DnaJ domain-containing protein [Arthrobacter sp. FW306-04-A]
MEDHSPDPYKVLHLDPAATAREVNRAYRALVRARHPDTRTPGAVAAGPDSGAQELGDQELRDQELRDIMDAYAVLRDPVKRAAYDRQRAGSPRPDNVPAPRQPHGPSRAAPNRPSGASLIIGPVRWEPPVDQAPGREPRGAWDPFHQLPDHRAARAKEEPAPGGYQMPWWILH